MYIYQVRVRAKRSELESKKRVKTMASRDPDNKTTMLVVGGGVCVVFIGLVFIIEFIDIFFKFEFMYFR